MNRIAVIMPKWIGDYIMALAVVEQKRRVDGVHVALITAPYLVELAKLLTTIEIIPYKTAEGLDRAQKGNYSDLYIFPHSISSAIWGFSTGIKNRHGYRKEGRSPLLTHSHAILNRKRYDHITTEYCNLLGIPPFSVNTVGGVILGTNQTDSIVLCPGAKYGPAKQWTHYSHLIATLPKNQNVIILGSRDEADYADQLIKENPDHSVESLCGKGSLVDAARILSSAKAVVSNDSGLMHLAAYVGAPVIGIFGSSTPTWTTPVGKSTVLYRSESCSPCFQRVCPFGHYNCLDKITVQEVISHIPTNM